MAGDWYVQHNGKQYGPMSAANLKKLAAERKIGPATTVRQGETGNWVPASRVKGLFADAAPKPAPAAAPKPAPAPKPAAKPPADFDELDEFDALMEPPIEPPPAPPRGNPLGTPVAPLAPRARLPKATPAPETPSVTPKIIGGVAIILGTVAVATCWLPMMGGLMGWTGIVTGAVGVLAGGIGLALAAIHKGSGLMLNVFGASNAAVGLVLSVVLGVTFGMFTSKPAPAPPPVVQQVIPQPMPEPVKEPEPEPQPPPIVWHDASEPIQQEMIKAQIKSVGIEPIALESSDLGTLKRQKPKPMLKVVVTIENTTADRIVAFTGWIGGGDLIGQGVGRLLEGSELGKAVQSATPTAQLTDNVGNPYQQVTMLSVFGAKLPGAEDNALRPAAKRDNDLIFPEPLPSIEFLHLELSPAAYGGTEPLRWQIPRGMIKGMPEAAAPPAAPPAETPAPAETPPTSGQ